MDGLKCLIFFSVFLTAFSISMENFDTKSFEENCKDLIADFSDSLKEFSVEASLHTEPFEVCRKAGFMYQEMLHEYNTLIKTTDSHNESCKHKFMDNNKMNFLETMKLNADKLWDKAHCSDCYENIDDYRAELTASNHSSEFYDIYYKHHEDCIEDYNSLKPDMKLNISLCSYCEETYKAINGFYNGLLKNKSGQLCFDLIDTMNKTRHSWSVEFKCFKQKRDSMVASVAVGLTLISLIIIFYTYMFLSGLRREESEMLDEIEASQSDLISPRSSTSGSGSSRSAPDSPKILKVHVVKNLFDDHDDDELLDCFDEDPILNIKHPYI